MAVWTYAGFENEANDQARLVMLRSHIGEVREKIAADVSADGKSRSSGSLNVYLQGLDDRRRELEEQLGESGKSPRVMPASFRAPH